jgi:hypothetical protein
MWMCSGRAGSFNAVLRCAPLHSKLVNGKLDILFLIELRREYRPARHILNKGVDLSISLPYSEVYA